MAPSDLRFFTEDWSVKIPSNLDLKLVRLTPPFYDEIIQFVSNPSNQPFAGDNDK